MSFTGNEDHSINLETASEWTENYRNNKGPNDPLAHFFGRAVIESILAQTDCVGIRIYYALDENGAKQMVISGVKANEDDLYNGVLAEKALKSPPYKGSNNALNS
jgi:hypothetical protein